LPREEGGLFICSDLGLGSNEAVARAADIVVIAVPPDKTAKVIAQTAPKMQKGALLVEICSLKMHLKRALELAAKQNIEVLSLHPLFGPVESIKGENIAAIKLKSGPKTKDVLTFLKSEGANVFETTLEEHDRKVATTQALFHLLMTRLDALADPCFKTKAFKIATARSKKLKKKRVLFKSIVGENPFLQNAIEQLNLQNETNIKERRKSAGMQDPRNDGPCSKAWSPKPCAGSARL